MTLLKLLLIYLFSFQLSISFACDCKSIEDLKKTQKESYNTSQLIFIGELVDSNKNNSYQFKVIEILKGNVNDSIIFGQYQSSCSDIPNRIGEIWLVYTNPNKDGIIDIDMCGLSRSFDQPFLKNKEASIYPPPNFTDSDATMALINYYIKRSIYTDKALNVLKNEIAQLRKWRDK